MLSTKRNSGALKAFLTGEKKFLIPPNMTISPFYLMVYYN
jgi:hypothetical protein